MRGDQSRIAALCAFVFQQELVERFQAINPAVPSDPYKQLDLAVKAVFQSWYNPRAVSVIIVFFATAADIITCASMYPSQAELPRNC